MFLNTANLYIACLFFVRISVSLTQDAETAANETFSKAKCESLLPNCLCYDLEIITGIVCKNVDNFSNFSSLLSSDAIFEINTTYEITFSNVKHLPAKLLEGLIVFRLILDDPKLTIDENVLEGVRRLRRFHVRRSSIKEIPDFRPISNSIRKIILDSSQLTALKRRSLQNLPLVNKLSFVNNSIRSIDPAVFEGTEGVLILDLSYNLLTSIPPRLLDPMVNLTKFSVSHNNLLHVNGIFSVTHPRFIYLDFNNITDVNSVLHPRMEKVETLVLASNPLKGISLYTFNGKIPKVRFLYLDHCGIQTFNATHYRSLDNIATLDLSYNLIEIVPEQTIDFGSKNGFELDFIGNRIKKFDAEISYNVKRIYLNENKLQSLDRTFRYTQVKEVSVARNQIKYLTQNDFKNAHETANLELQGNKIGRIDRLTFVSFRNSLNYLDLSSNFIPYLNGSVMFISRLKLLNLTDNVIQTFENDEFTGLNELSELYLQQNQILTLNGQLQQLQQLQYLVIIHNNIETLQEEQLPKNLKFIYLADNPIKCDCRLLPFVLWLNSSGAPATDVDLCVASDANDKGGRPKPQCPRMCECGCDKYGSMHFISVDCSSKNLSAVPPLLGNNFLSRQTNSTISFDFRRSVVLDQNVHPSLHIEDLVLGINLENNSLESLEGVQLPPELIHLYLSDNKLRRIPEPTLYRLQNLKRVSLADNPWDCDCNSLEFKKWLLSNRDVVQDFNRTQCGLSKSGETTLVGKAIYTLTDIDLCPADIGMIVSIAFGVLVFLSLCLSTKILYTKYELNIKVFLYSRGMTCVKQRDSETDKKFDAFISFSHKDDKFVTKEIISVIENKDPNIRLCIHYRHFRPGEFIHDNIIQAVQNSKRTILILSRNFLESEWCLMEFRAAHVQALEDRMHRIIVIKVGELPKEIHPTIKVYLDSTTYLTWGEKHFWNNLLYVLPTSSTQRNPVPKNVKIEQFI